VADAIWVRNVRAKHVLVRVPVTRLRTALAGALVVAGLACAVLAAWVAPPTHAKKR